MKRVLFANAVASYTYIFLPVFLANDEYMNTYKMIMVRKQEERAHQ